MSEHSHADDAEGRKDLKRVTREIAGRLAAKGIRLLGDETPDEVTAIADAVERFELAVESRGADLMMDEPLPGHKGQPDDPRFLLPSKGPALSPAQYVELLDRAIDDIRTRRHRG